MKRSVLAYKKRLFIFLCDLLPALQNCSNHILSSLNHTQTMLRGVCNLVIELKCHPWDRFFHIWKQEVATIQIWWKERMGQKLAAQFIKFGLSEGRSMKRCVVVMKKHFFLHKKRRFSTIKHRFEPIIQTSNHSYPINHYYSYIHWQSYFYSLLKIKFSSR